MYIVLSALKDAFERPLEPAKKEEKEEKVEEREQRLNVREIPSLVNAVLHEWKSSLDEETLFALSNYWKMEEQEAILLKDLLLCAVQRDKELDQCTEPKVSFTTRADCRVEFRLDFKSTE